MSTYQKLSIAVGVVIAALLVAIALGQRPVEKKLAGSQTLNKFQSVATSSRATVGPQASLRVLASSTPSFDPDRSWVRIDNTTGGNIYLSINSDARAVVGEGIFLAASSTIEFDLDKLYTGSIQAIAATGVATGTVTVTSN